MTFPTSPTFTTTTTTTTTTMMGQATANDASITTCNGFSNLCNVSVNEIMMPMIHNAMSSPNHGFTFAANHMNDPFNDALERGYRGLSLDVCNCDDGLLLCHGSSAVGCGIGGRNPVSTLQLLNSWLIANPGELVVLNLELNGEAGGPVTLLDVESIVNGVGDGFAARLYHHPEDGMDPPTSPTDWPKLGTLLNDGKQVILFYHRGPTGDGVHPDGIHYLYDYTMETEFSFKDQEEIETVIIDGNCPVDRGQSSNGDWLFINNFVTLDTIFGQFQPSQDDAKIINTVEFADRLVKACQSRHGQKLPNFISVDFWSEGNLVQLANMYNSQIGVEPSEAPTSAPTGLSASPTAMPTTTMQPTQQPTAQPTAQPTDGESGCPQRISFTNMILALSLGVSLLLPDP
eukprot:CAMPEP_0198112266 /NCGR_PEP_ID=MMETSP1442-20131203/4140_1 /TAXON_ID= /ORGANISM="Craspedostauros australis, Strain CCMP3328" /LENGTH=401 /DNA_ID=CAMNT_0043768979 /DNA_START=212 /DNA_END=1417 /DNA_ORIENTATION=+